MQTNNITVLIVDDNVMKPVPFINQLKARYPEVVVRRAFTLSEAYRLFGTETPHCVVLDGCMAGGGQLDTLPFIEHVRKFSETLPVLANATFPHMSHEMVEAGATEFLDENPIDAADQVARLSAVYTATIA